MDNPLVDQIMAVTPDEKFWDSLVGHQLGRVITKPFHGTSMQDKSFFYWNEAQLHQLDDHELKVLYKNITGRDPVSNQDLGLIRNKAIFKVKTSHGDIRRIAVDMMEVCAIEQLGENSIKMELKSGAAYILPAEFDGVYEMWIEITGA